MARRTPKPEMMSCGLELQISCTWSWQLHSDTHTCCHAEIGSAVCKYYITPRRVCTLQYVRNKNGDFRLLTAQNTLNQSKEKPAHVINSSRSHNTPCFIHIPPPVASPQMVKLGLWCDFFNFSGFSFIGKVHTAHSVSIYCIPINAVWGSGVPFGISSICWYISPHSVVNLKKSPNFEAVTGFYCLNIFLNILAME